jgi:hypothetical protein
MRHRISLAVCLILALPACADDTAVHTDDAAPPDAAPLDAAPARQCIKACSTAADCGDADSYACTAGRCEFRGCEITGTCPAPYVCAASALMGMRVCQQACSAPEDCTPTWGTYGADTCLESGLCGSPGCPSTAWCEANMSLDLDLVCETDGDDPVPGCWPVCTTDDDCVSTVLNAPMVCDPDGRCAYRECVSDSECVTWWGAGHRCL